MRIEQKSHQGVEVATEIIERVSAAVDDDFVRPFKMRTHLRRIEHFITERDQ